MSESLARAIGILGGTFDPVHFGHLRVAVELQQDLNLREVRIMPCARPAHRAEPVADAQQRVEMLKRALANETVLKLDTTEFQRQGPSYTVDTLIGLRQELGSEQSLCLIMGTDAFAGLPSWHRWQKLFDLAHIILAHRPGWMQVPKVLGNLDVGARMTEDMMALHRQPAGLILPWAVTQLEISATAIRQCVRDGKSVRYLLPEAVREYIETHGLYR